MVVCSKCYNQIMASDKRCPNAKCKTEEFQLVDANHSQPSMLLINRLTKIHRCEPEAGDAQDDQESQAAGKEMTLFELASHLKTDCKLLRYCHDCDQIFETVDDLRQHLEYACPSVEINCPKCEDAFLRNTIFKDENHQCNLVEDIPLLEEKVTEVLQDKNNQIQLKTKQIEDKEHRMRQMEQECLLYRESLETKRKMVDFIMNPKDKISCKLNPQAKIKFFGNGSCSHCKKPNTIFFMFREANGYNCGCKFHSNDKNNLCLNCILVNPDNHDIPSYLAYDSKSPLSTPAKAALMQK